MKNVTYFLPLILLALVTSYRVYINCFGPSLHASCIEPTKSFFLDETKIPGKYLVPFRNYLIVLPKKYLPSPHSELVIGMVLGADELGKVPTFKDNLKNTGTIHVVVVSGFNISLVSGFITSFLGSKYKLKNLVLAQAITFLYAILTGFEPPVIRAWVMGFLVSLAKYYGRGLDAFRVLVFTALVMVLLYPYFLFSFSFQLSFLATLGLVIYGNFFINLFKKIFNSDSFLVEDFSTTISAQVFVIPLVSHYFGRISLISFLVNPLVLWTVPISTILGTCFVVFACFSRAISYVFVFFLYPFLDIFTQLISFFGEFKFSSVDFGASIATMVIYYLFTLAVGYLINRKVGKIYENK